MVKFSILLFNRITKLKLEMSRKRAKITPEYEDMESEKKFKEIWKPENWEDVFENLRKMREIRNAPCDMGKADKSKYSEKERRFHCLVALMLSSQTKDEVNHAAVTRLKGRLIFFPNK